MSAPDPIPVPSPAPATPAAPPASGGLSAWFNGQSPLVRHTIAGLATVLLTLLSTYLAAKLGVAAPPVPIIDVATAPTNPAALPEGRTASIEPPTPMAMGWYDNPEVASAAKASLKTVFRSTPAGADTVLPKDVFQWQTYKKVRGKPKPDKNQNPIGSCVAFGSTTASENSLICAIAAGEPFEFTEFSEEVSYALMRVDIGRGELRGQDGAVGAWAARARTELGALPKGKSVDGQDFSKYDPNRCRKLGDIGVSAAIHAEAAKYKAGDAALLRTWLDVKKALAAGCGVYTCSKIGFSATRDANGVAFEQGVWGHCMNIDGYHVDDDGHEYAHFDNSWDGVYHKGPVGWGEPNGAGFWCKSSTVAKMLSEGDSFALSAVKGMPKLELDWFTISNPAKARDPFALAPIDREEFRAANRHALAW